MDPDDIKTCDECMCNFDCSEVVWTPSGDFCFDCYKKHCERVINGDEDE